MLAQHKKAKSVFDSRPNQTNLSLNIKYEKAVEEKYQSLVAGFLANPESIMVSEEKSGLTSKEQFEGLVKSKNHALDVLKRTNSIVTRDKCDSFVTDFMKNLICAGINYCIDSGDQPVELDKEIARMCDCSKLDCATFAFLKLKDSDFIKYLSMHKQCPNGLFNGQHLSLLHDWNYRQIDEPDEGDLVIYFNRHEEPQKIKATHFGIYTSDGKIISKKMGIRFNAIFMHNINTTPLNYGDLFAFFRKNRFLY